MDHIVTVSVMTEVSVTGRSLREAVCPLSHLNPALWTWAPPCPVVMCPHGAAVLINEPHSRWKSLLWVPQCWGLCVSCTRSCCLPGPGSGCSEGRERDSHGLAWGTARPRSRFLCSLRLVPFAELTHQSSTVTEVNGRCL